ncbi:MAG: HAMP domain-containing sensor histidine kinase [Patescibacteria group bacterium]
MEIAIMVILLFTYRKRRQWHLLMMAFFLFFSGLVNLFQPLGQALALNGYPNPFVALIPVQPTIVLIGTIFYTFAIIDLYSSKKWKLVHHVLTMLPLLISLFFTTALLRQSFGVAMPVQTSVIDFLSSPYLGWILLNTIVTIASFIVYRRKKTAGRNDFMPDFFLFLGSLLTVLTSLLVAMLIALNWDEGAMFIYILMLIYIPIKTLGIVASKNPDSTIIDSPKNIITRHLSVKMALTSIVSFSIFSFLLMNIISSFFINIVIERNQIHISEELQDAKMLLAQEFSMNEFDISRCIHELVNNEGECDAFDVQVDNYVDDDTTEYTIVRDFFTGNLSQEDIIIRTTVTTNHPTLGPIRLKKERHATLTSLGFCDKNYSLPISGCGIINENQDVISYRGNLPSGSIVESQFDSSGSEISVINFGRLSDSSSVFVINDENRRIFINLSSADVDLELLKMQSFVTLITFLFLLLMMLPIYLGVSIPLRMLIPLRRSLELMKSRSGIQPIALTTPDEIGDLSRSLSEMTRSVHLRTEELNEKIRQQRDFIGMTVHELKTPLNAFRWALESMDEKKNGIISNEEKLEMADYLMRSSDHMREMVNSLLQVSRLDREKIKVKFKTIDISRLVALACSELRPLAVEKNISFNFYPDVKGECVAAADADMLRHAIDNFISNAIKYTPDDGTVLVKIERLNNQSAIRVTVEDNGLGIPINDQKYIFNQFFRAENAKSSEIDGTGLGLNIAKRFIELHQGKIGFTSKENVGTTFWFEVPIEHVATNGAGND